MIRTIIGDEEWHIYLVPESDMRVIKDDSDEPAATTDVETKEVHVVVEHMSEEVVAHEIFHIYNHYLFLWDTKLSIDDYEEIQANLFAHKRKVMNKKVDDVYAALLKLKDDPELELVV